MEGSLHHWKKPQVACRIDLSFNDEEINMEINPLYNLSIKTFSENGAQMKLRLIQVWDVTEITITTQVEIWRDAGTG